MTKVKTIITTDVEVDDMNSLIHLCLYLNEIDLKGVVYTASQYHFLGDGIHTLGEITSHYHTSGPAGLQRPRSVFGVDPGAKDCMSFRPFPKGWIERLWKNEYAQVYPYLIQHDTSYPSPEHLLSITKYGNVAFEGDVRFDTEGSNLIRDAMLEDSDDILYLQSWGGVNTIVRALLSIYEEFGQTEQWSTIRDRVSRRTKILGVINQMGQDHSYLDRKIDKLYPNLELLNTEFLYGLYFAPLHTQADSIHMFQGDWLHPNIQCGHGPLNEAYHLMGDGKVLEGEADVYQFGIHSTIDYGRPDVPVATFQPYDFLGEGDSNTYIPLLGFGLRGLENHRYPTLLGRLHSSLSPLVSHDHDVPINPFLQAYQQDWAARSLWCHNDYAHANHSPIIQLDAYDFVANANECVELFARVMDPDGDDVSIAWETYANFNQYQGKQDLWIDAKGEHAIVHIPADAQSKDFFSIIVRAKDMGTPQMTGFAQVVITIH